MLGWIPPAHQIPPASTSRSSQQHHTGLPFDSICSRKPPVKDRLSVFTRVPTVAFKIAPRFLSPWLDRCPQGRHLRSHQRRFLFNSQEFQGHRVGPLHQPARDEKNRIPASPNAPLQQDFSGIPFQSPGIKVILHRLSQTNSSPCAHRPNPRSSHQKQAARDPKMGPPQKKTGEGQTQPAKCGQQNPGKEKPDLSFGKG